MAGPPRAPPAGSALPADLARGGAGRRPAASTGGGGGTVGQTFPRQGRTNMIRAGVPLLVLLLSRLAALAACSTMGEPGPYSDALPSYTPSSIPTATPG